MEDGERISPIGNQLARWAMTRRNPIERSEIW